MSAVGGHDAAYAQVVWFVASGIGAAAIAALILIYRRAASRRELEVAEQVLEDAYRER